MAPGGRHAFAFCNQFWFLNMLTRTIDLFVEFLHLLDPVVRGICTSDTCVRVRVCFCVAFESLSMLLLCALS